MDFNDKTQVLSEIIHDIEHEMAIISLDLPKAYRMIAPARRVRVMSLNLEKLFKRFRRISCEIGLK